MRNSVWIVLSVILLSKLTWGRGLQDYWDEDYDQDQNCVSKDLIVTLDDQKRCVKNTIQDPNQSIEDCKRTLTKEVLGPCMGNTNQLPQTGKLLYCVNRAQTTCCIHNYTCNGYRETNKNLKFNAANFLTDKEAYLAKEVKRRGFHNCHPIAGLDARKCAEECKSLLKTSPLLDHCKKKGGLLKCCVRRDKVFCDECRYCCTLPFCSYKDENGEIIVEGENILTANKIADQEIETHAVYELKAINRLYKGYDNRCLKPDENKPAEKWDHYDPDEFYKALTKEELEQAKTWTFDKNFINFVDPGVMKKFTDPKKTDIWKKTYGFDYVHVEPKGEFRLYPEAVKACMKKELKSSFAKKCRKDQGFFKCCQLVLTLSAFVEARQYLINQSFIEKNPFDDEIPPSPFVAVVTFSCTVQNKLTGEVTTRYNSPEKNPIGGIVINDKRLGFRNMMCFSMNLCLDRIGFYDTDLYNFNTREEFCKAENTISNTMVLTIQNSDVRIKDEPKGVIESVDSCMKRKSVIRICPKEVLKAINNSSVSETNNEVLKFKQKIKRKKKASRKKKKKNRAKKTKKKKKGRKARPRSGRQSEKNSKKRREKRRKRKKKKEKKSY